MIFISCSLLCQKHQRILFAWSITICTYTWWNFQSKYFYWYTYFCLLFQRVCACNSVLLDWGTHTKKKLCFQFTEKKTQKLLLRSFWKFAKFQSNHFCYYSTEFQTCSWRWERIFNSFAIHIVVSAGHKRASFDVHTPQ